VQVMRLDQMLGEVLMVEAGIAGLGQADDLALKRRWESVMGRPSAVAMGQGRGSQAPEAGQETPAVAQREA
jgi:hypothetical protein